MGHSVMRSGTFGERSHSAPLCEADRGYRDASPEGAALLDRQHFSSPSDPPDLVGAGHFGFPGQGPVRLIPMGATPVRRAGCSS